jgi:hypothetical protein
MIISHSRSKEVKATLLPVMQKADHSGLNPTPIIVFKTLSAEIAVDDKKYSLQACEVLTIGRSFSRCL